MANVDAPFGFSPVRMKGGQEVEVNRYTVDASIEIFPGMLLCINTTSEVVLYTTTLADAGKIAGVSGQYLAAAATPRIIEVYDDPGQMFEVQLDDNAVSTEAGTRGQCFKFINAQTGNTTLEQSRTELDASSGGSVYGTDAATIAPFQADRQVEAIGHTQFVTNSRVQGRIVSQAHYRGVGTGSNGTIATDELYTGP